MFNHDDPTLVLADLVIKNRVKRHQKRTDDDDDEDWGVFDDDVGTSDDPDAMKVFEQEQARRHRVRAYKREQEEVVRLHCYPRACLERAACGMGFGGVWLALCVGKRRAGC